ncbi:ARM repeat-containing protein [Hesseltinella vesiculosa]|uniref:ARM repeat-containing protein n=1 Tax=Hesseltinella vesiculosa TaxID=101127 RepID=A0A1X2G8J0_9FUNG|nr:ARM repeat-containing protein [Hesseltinella vesiculosa]
MTDARSQLLGVLIDATSQDYTRLKQSETLLKQWETEPSFFATLQDIFYDRLIDHDVRFLSGIYLKNGVDRFWRRTAKNPISQEEKIMIRNRLLQFMAEPSKKLSTQNTVIVARIARLDYPAQWPDLMTNLLHQIESPGDGDMLTVHHRSLSTLNEVIGELSTRVLSSGRRQFAELAPPTFQVIANVYISYVNQILSHWGHSGDTLQQLEILGICIHCLRILMVNGIRDIHKFDDTKVFLDVSYQHLKNFMEYRSVLLSNSNVPLQGALENVIDEYGSLYINLQKSHPVSVALCPHWIDIISYYWSYVVEEGDKVAHQFGKKTSSTIFTQFLLHGLQLIKGTIKNVAYDTERPDFDNLAITDEEKALAAEGRRIIREGVVTSSFVHTCAETLVSKYMLLTPSDLEQWEEDPEEWANAVDAENWEFELRPCAEATFMNLLAQHRDQLTPIILNLVDQVGVTDFQSILFRDAIYDAVGLGVHSLYGRLDFESFVANRLMSEAANKDPIYKILRRRIAWVLGRWVTESISAECRTAIYEILLQLMVKEEDLVVRLSAAHSLKMAIDDWDFDISILLPYLEPAMNLLMILVTDVEESDSVMKLISDLNTIMDRAGAYVAPYAPKLMDLLTPLWHRAGSEPLFQSALVVTFTKIAAILNEQSSQLFSFLVPMVAYCCNRQNEAHVYLLEDALDLWWTLLQGSTQPDPSLTELIPLAVDLLDYDTENVRKVLWIIESYVLLDSSAVIQTCGGSLFQHLGSYIMNAKPEVASNITHTIDLVLQTSPLAICGDALIQSGLLNAILEAFLQDKNYAYANMWYMSIFARLSLQDASFVLKFIQAAGNQTNPPIANFFGDVVERWIDKFDNIGHPRQRKLACLALTHLLQLQDPAMIDHINGIMNIWADVGTEMKESDGESIMYSEADLEDDIAQLEESPEKVRKSHLLQQDPVYTSNLLLTIQKTMVTFGGVSFFSDKVDSVLLDQVNRLLTH